MNKLQQNHFVIGLVWIALMGAAYLYFDARAKPPAAVVVDGAVSIPRARDGYFYINGTVNGIAMRFLIDTGASSVSVSRAAADQAGLPQGRSVEFMTAAGPVRGSIVDNITVVAGGIQVNGLSVGITPSTAPEALLGQNFLRHLDVVIRDDVLLLRTRRKGDNA